LNELLNNRLGDNIENFDRPEWISRLLQSPPNQDLVSMEDIIVVPDTSEKYPDFARVLYCDLDKSLVLLYIMLFIVLDEAIGRPGDNGLIALFVVYVFERFLRMVREDWGKSNLCEKAYVDERFLG